MSWIKYNDYLEYNSDNNTVRLAGKKKPLTNAIYVPARDKIIRSWSKYVDLSKVYYDSDWEGYYETFDGEDDCKLTNEVSEISKERWVKLDNFSDYVFNGIEIINLSTGKLIGLLTTGFSLKDDTGKRVVLDSWDITMRYLEKAKELGLQL